MNMGWSASILPWLEQKPLFDRLNFSLPVHERGQLDGRLHRAGGLSLPVRAEEDLLEPGAGRQLLIFGRRRLRRDVRSARTASPTFTNNPPCGPMIFNQVVSLGADR